MARFAWGEGLNLHEIFAQRTGSVRSLGTALLTCLAAAVAIFMLATVLHFSRFGLDFTDESFYLAAIAHPSAYAFNIPVSLFGFVYHPLFTVLDGDIGALRQANILITFGLAWCLSFAVLRHAQVRGVVSAAQCWMMALALAPLSLVSLTAWLVTPNYNTLTFQGLMLAVMGLLLMDDRHSRLVSVGILLVALGGWLTFTAKPTSAALLAIFFLLYSSLSGGWHLRRMALAGAIALLLLIAISVLIDGTPGRFIGRLRDSAEMLHVLGSGQEIGKIFRIDGIDYTAREYLTALLAGVAVTLCGIALTLARLGWQALGGAVCLAMACAAVWIVGKGHAPVDLRSVVIFGISVACVAGAWVVRGWRSTSSVLRRRLLLAFVMFTLPHVAAFGTNSNYWRSGAASALFWGLAAVLACRAIAPAFSSRVLLFPLIFMMQMSAAAGIDNAISFPYRQPSLRENAASFDLPGGGRLVLSDDYRAYLATAVTLARSQGLQPGMPMIDLTGRSPGVLYAMQAHGLGQPWMVGAYPGSDRLAMESLDTEKCGDIARAWLLDEPEGPRSLTTRAVLAYFGADLDADYVRVGTLMTPPGAGGHPLAYPQYLLKPARLPSTATAACVASRARHSMRPKEKNNE